MVEEELVLPNTQNLFYLQLKNDVITGRLRVTEPETAVLLASYHIQAELGDIEDLDDFPPDLGNGQSWEQHMLERVKQLQPILPDYVINSNPGMTPENWYSEVFKAHQDLRGLSYEESKLEYVKLCSKIVNFGVIYFLIKGTSLIYLFDFRPIFQLAKIMKHQLTTGLVSVPMESISILPKIN